GRWACGQGSARSDAGLTRLAPQPLLTRGRKLKPLLAVATKIDAVAHFFVARFRLWACERGHPAEERRSPSLRFWRVFGRYCPAGGRRSRGSVKQLKRLPRGQSGRVAGYKFLLNKIVS